MDPDPPDHPGPGGLADKDPKNNRGRYIPIMREIRP
jgi:hypothetical protein